MLADGDRCRKFLGLHATLNTTLPNLNRLRSIGYSFRIASALVANEKLLTAKAGEA
jgi:hypothetical protein